MAKKLTLIIFAVLAALCLCGCGTKSEDAGTKKITIAYQYGMAYAPMTVMREQNLIEKYYGEPITVEWAQLNSGSAINEGIITGSIDAGAMGIAPAITGMLKGISYKIFSAVSAQPQVLMTHNDSLSSLSDFTSENKIALVNIGSIQHIMLAMAAKEELGDAHALDNNIVAMSHPDGMSALLSGAVDAQLTTSPYVYKERGQEGIGELDAIEKVWPEGSTFIVGVASEKVHEDEKLYQALVDAMNEALDFLTDNKEAAAEMLCGSEGVTAEVMLEWLNDPACIYSAETKGVTRMAQFMVDEGFAEGTLEGFSQLAYDNVAGD